MAKVRKDFIESELSRIVEMAWEDRTPFEAIERTFSLNEAAVNAAFVGGLPRLLRHAVQAAVA